MLHKKTATIKYSLNRVFICLLLQPEIFQHYYMIL